VTLLDLDRAQAWARAPGPHINASQCKQADALILRLVDEARAARPIVDEARELGFLKSLSEKVAAYDKAVGP
jgi:hypothetical protein